MWYFSKHGTAQSGTSHGFTLQYRDSSRIQTRNSFVIRETYHEKSHFRYFLLKSGIFKVNGNLLFYTRETQFRENEAGQQIRARRWDIGVKFRKRLWIHGAGTWEERQ